jgi:hypothetical protein
MNNKFYVREYRTTLLRCSYTENTGQSKDLDYKKKKMSTDRENGRGNKGARVTRG